MLALAALLALAGAIVAFVTIESIDWSAYQGPLVEWVETSTGRRLQVRGETRVDLAWSPAVRVSGLSLANAAWGSRAQMLTLERVAVRLRLLPLLAGRLAVARIELEGLDLLVETDAEGRHNWDFETREGAATLREAEAPLRLPLDTFLRRIDVERVRVELRDPASPAPREFWIDRATARTRDEAAPLEVELEAHHDDDPLTAEATLEGIRGLLAGEPVQLRADVRGVRARAQIEGSVGRPLELEGLDLRLVLDGESLAALSGIAGVPLPDRGAFHLEGRLLESRPGLRFEELSLRIGGSELRGQGGTELSEGRRRWAFALRGPSFDLEDWLPERDPDVQRPPPAERPLLPVEPIPVEELRAVDLDLSLRADEVRLPRLELRDVDLQATLDRGRLRLGHLVTSVGGGRALVSGLLDARRNPPSVEARASLEGIELGPLLDRLRATDLLGGGPLDASLELSGSGRTPRDILASLSGPLRLRLGPGRLDGDWPKLVPPERRSIVGTRTDDVELNCVVGSFDFVEGVAQVEQLVIDTIGLALFVGGLVDLRSETLFLSFDLARLRNVAGARTVATVAGPLEAPVLGLDRTAIAGKAAVLAMRLALLGSLPKGQATEGPKRCDRLLEARAAAQD
jgi:uncharacterized protein involved in outer membrane biogenesis